MKRIISSIAGACAALTLVAVAAPAEASPGHAVAYHGGGYHGGGYHGGYYHGGGWYRGGWYGGRWWPGYWGLGVGLGIGLGTAAYYADGYGYPVYPGYAVAPPVVYDTPVASSPAPVAAATAPDPVIYPRNGQSAARMESDRRECNRWATSQPNAMSDGNVFQRATQACMDGRGYTIR